MPSQTGVHPFDGYGEYNPYCMICADERGGPIGHESSECAWREAKNGMELALTMPVKKRLHFYVCLTHADLHDIKCQSCTEGSTDAT